jgi:hypothetical protein
VRKALWRVTFESHSKAFVEALAFIFQWEIKVFHRDIKQALDMTLEAAESQHIL